jgi:hypothetical protein
MYRLEFYYHLIVIKKLVDFAEKLLVYFVETFEDIYGAQVSSHNIYTLIHLADDYRNYCSLDNYLCFPFENFMKFLKVMVRIPDSENIRNL